MQITGKKAGLLAAMLLAGFLPVLAQQTLVWEENFNSTTIDSQTWTYDIGDGCDRGICGWGNNELEYYTNRPENARVENGNLLIEARRENMGGKPFTSARLRTYGRVHFKYGTLEARIKVPNLANGLWPAFWMLGATGNWPASGEIDIVEMGNVNAIRDGVINQRVGAAVHWQNNGSHAFYSRDYNSPTDLTDDYHLYKLTWDSQFIRVYIDDIEYFAFDISRAAAADLEEFHHAHYILLNLAVGGNYTGINSAAGVTAPLPAQMYVDYIKLYQNAGEDLFLGMNAAKTGEFGIYTETTPVTDRLTFEQDANLYLWNNLTPIAGATAYEGTEVLALRAAPGNWFGFGVENQLINMLNFSNGFLKFHMKTTSLATFKVGIKSGSGESWLNFINGQNQYGLVRDGNWHEVSIPLSAFANLDLGSITQSFMLAGDAPAAQTDLYIDNIYYSGGAAANPAPIVNLTAPANNAVFTAPASISLEATATDANGTVTKVDFYNGATLLGTDQTSPYSFTWTDVAPGTYTVTAKATDNEGAVTTSKGALVFVSNPGNTPPVVSIASPGNNASFTTPATITLDANASDDGSIYKVEFYNGNTLLGTDFSNPYSFVWANVTTGTYVITAKATDNGALTTTSAPVNIVVNDNAVVSDRFGIYTENAQITTKLVYEQDANLYLWNNLANLPGATPYEGAEVLALRAAPGNWFGFGVANAVKNLTHFANGSLKFHMKTSSTATFKVGIKSVTAESWRDFINGQNQYGLVRDGQWHEVSIPLSAFSGLDLSAIDQTFMMAGDAPATNFDFYIDNIYYQAQSSNSAPTVSLTAPSNNASYIAPASITLTANAADSDGTIAKVEFYNGNTLLGTATASPYSFVWTNVGEGSYTLTAKATDNAGASTTSAAVSVTVNGGGGSGEYCATAANGDYSYKAVTLGNQVDFTFHPLGETAGGNLAIIYIREGGSGAYPGYGMNKQSNGDFTFSRSIAAGTQLSIYFTYQVGANGPERNSAANPHSYTVGETCGEAPINVAPTVSLTSPANNMTFTAPASITLIANAVDGDGTIAKVEFYNGNTLLGTATTSPHSFVWTNVAEGSYALIAKATDNAGASTTSAAVSVVVNAAPLTGNYGIYTEAAQIVNKLTFGLDAELYYWNNLSNIPSPTPYEGNDVLAVRAVAGNWFGFGIDNATKNLQHVAAGSLRLHFKTTYAGAFKIGIKSGNNVESWIEFGASVQKYGLVRDGQWHEVAIPFADFAGIVLEAIDQAVMFAGDAPSGTADFYFDNIYYSTELPNVAPTVILTSPANNVTFTAPASITLAANAADSDGTITKVEFFNGNTLLGIATASPYSFVWNNVPAGTYLITAKATDNRGATATSEAVGVMVYSCSQYQAPAITVNPSLKVYPGGQANTIYLGYGPQSVSLIASHPAPASYRWSPATGLSSTVIPNPVFAPKAAGTYTFTVTSTNSVNCTASASVTIRVVDIRCGNKLDKVLVCEKRKEQCVSENQVKKMLLQGGILGGCSASSGQHARMIAHEADLPESDLTLAPNPAQGKTSIHFIVATEGKYKLALYDLKGVMVKEIANGQAAQGETLVYDLDVDVTPYARGIYVVRLLTDATVTTKRLMIER
jgi:beta-glucanase (GH16 family)/PKD repeat protein